MKNTITGKRVATCLWALTVASLWLAACGQATPTPFPTLANDIAEATGAPQPTDTPEPDWETFHSTEGQFRIDLPGDWQVEEHGQTPLGWQYALGPEPLGPGPATSMLFVAPADELTAREAAEGLACEDGCEEEIGLEEATVGDVPAQRAVLGTAPPLEWYFVSNGERLVYFSIHDPDSFDTREDIIATFAFDEPAPEAEATSLPAMVTATVEATAAPLVTVEAVRQWQEVVVEEAGLSFEAPANWSGAEEYVWAPDDGSPLSLHFGWQQVAPQAVAGDSLDARLEIVATEPLTLSWGSGISATVRAAETVQRHLLLQVGLRVYDFYTQGPSQQAVEAAQPVLDHVVESVTIRQRLLYLEDPVDAAIAFFRVILRDPTGEEALPYLGSDLQTELAESGDPLALLVLPQRFQTFNLEWKSGSESEAVLEGTFTLVDDTTAVRDVYLAFDEAIGWRIEAIEIPPDAPAESSER